MFTNKTTWSILGLASIGLVIVSLAGFALLAVLVDELGEEADIGWAVPNFIQTFFTGGETWQDSSGNELTGYATALLFGASSVPVGLDLTSRAMLRYLPLGERIKTFIRRINNVQRKYLMPFHTYMSILALGLGSLHLLLSSCVANPFPELGLILSGILVATGLLFKWKTVPTAFRKTLYKFHASLIVSGVLLVVLFTGHAIMALD